MIICQLLFPLFKRKTKSEQKNKKTGTITKTTAEVRYHSYLIHFHKKTKQVINAYMTLLEKRAHKNVSTK